MRPNFQEFLTLIFTYFKIFMFSCFTLFNSIATHVVRLFALGALYTSMQVATWAAFFVGFAWTAQTTELMRFFRFCFVLESAICSGRGVKYRIIINTESMRNGVAIAFRL